MFNKFMESISMAKKRRASKKKVELEEIEVAPMEIQEEFIAPTEPIEVKDTKESLIAEGYVHLKTKPDGTLVYAKNGVRKFIEA